MWFNNNVNVYNTFLNIFNVLNYSKVLLKVYQIHVTLVLRILFQ